MGNDYWLMDHYDPDDALQKLTGAVVMNTTRFHAADVSYTLRHAYGVNDYEDCDDCFTEEDIRAHIECFPEGQFMIIRLGGPNAGCAVSTAITMRTSRPPTAPILPWREAIGDMTLGAHEPEGNWLYGVEMAVHGMYRGHGFGTGLYDVRFQLVKDLNLRGWYAVGMLMGYHDILEDELRESERFELFNMRGGRRREDLLRDGMLRQVDAQLTGFPRHSDKLTPTEYGEKVIARKYKDPTVTMQMNRGFRAVRVVTDYCDEPAAGDAGVLIVWENPDYEC